MPAGKACPVCGEKAPCIDWDSAPYGMGVQSYNEQYECGLHGVFAFGLRGWESSVIWRDVEPDEHERHVLASIERGALEIEALQRLLSP